MYWTNGYCYEPQGTLSSLLNLYNNEITGISAPPVLVEAYATSDTIGVVLDFVSEHVIFYRNGVQQVIDCIINGYNE